VYAVAATRVVVVVVVDVGAGGVAIGECISDTKIPCVNYYFKYLLYVYVYICMY
jgi:hypothetical protein